MSLKEKIIGLILIIILVVVIYKSSQNDKKQEISIDNNKHITEGKVFKLFKGEVLLIYTTIIIID